MITRLDRDVGRLLKRIDDLGLRENTIVFFTSDNGAAAANWTQYFNSSGPLRGAKGSFYEGGIRVPMIVRWPGVAPAGSVSDHVGYFGDLLATAAALAGVSAPVDHDGVSFAPTIEGRADEQPSHDFLYWEFYERGSAQAVSKSKWKAVVQPMGGSGIELYDL